MKNRIRVLRGTNNTIAGSNVTLPAGQPLYNTDKNYLTISKNGTPNQQPIQVRTVQGWYSDMSKITSLKTADTDKFKNDYNGNFYYFGEKYINSTEGNKVVIKAPSVGNSTSNSGKIEFRIDSDPLGNNGNPILTLERNTASGSTTNSINLSGIGGGIVKSMLSGTNFKTSAFSGDNTSVCIAPQQNNEINFGTIAPTDGSNGAIYFGYRTLNTAVSKYYFGNGKGAGGESAGELFCGKVTIAGTTIVGSNISTGEISGSKLSITGTISGLAIDSTTSVTTPALYTNSIAPSTSTSIGISSNVTVDSTYTFTSDKIKTKSILVTNSETSLLSWDANNNSLSLYGGVKCTQNNVEINNSLTVTKTLKLGTTEINGTASITGTTTVNGTLTVSNLIINS